MMYLLYGNPILIAAAVIPAIFLLVQINKADKLDREPVGLLVSLVIQGIISTALAVLTERLGTAILDSLWPENALVYRVLMYFAVVGLSEEGFKYLLLKRRTWYSPDFNCQFDGVVYAVCVALGFALWENIGYVVMYRPGPGHHRRAGPRLLRCIHGRFLWHGPALCQLRLRACLQKLPPPGGAGAYGAPRDL